MSPTYVYAAGPPGDAAFHQHDFPDPVQRGFVCGQPEHAELFTGVSGPGRPHQTRHHDLPQRNPALNPLNLIPDMSFSSIQNYANPSMSDGTPYFNQNTIYSFIDNISKIHGSHVFKAGDLFRTHAEDPERRSADPGQHQLQHRRQQSGRLEQLLRQRAARQLRQLLGSAAAARNRITFSPTRNGLSRTIGR